MSKDKPWKVQPSNQPKGTPLNQLPPVGAPSPQPQITIPPPAPPAWPPDDKAALTSLLNRIETKRGRPAIVYWTSPVARISLAAELPLYDQLQMIGKQPAIDLILYTNGGDAEAPYRFVSLMREFCERLAVLLPHRAASAGTMISMGANEIVMTPLSVLGPIDPSRTHPLLPKREGADAPEPISVQDMRHAMAFIRESAPLGVAYTPDALAQIFSALFEKIHPLAIGAIEQTYALAKLVGTRCLETHMDPAKDSAKIKAIVDRLCDEYKSHQYPLPRKEAQSIGLPVVEADAELEGALTDLFKFYSSRPVAQTNPPPKPGQQLKTQIARLDSLRGNFRVEGKAIVGPKGELQPAGDEWIRY